MTTSNRNKAAKNGKAEQFGSGDKYPIYVEHQGYHLYPDIQYGDRLRIDPIRHPEDGDFVFARISDGSLVVQKYILLGKQGQKGKLPFLTYTDELIERQTWTAKEFTVLGVVVRVEREFYPWKPAQSD